MAPPVLHATAKIFGELFNKMAPPVLHATAKIFGELFNKGATRLSHFEHYKEDILSS
jgi:hypothetical protein